MSRSLRVLFLAVTIMGCVPMRQGAAGASPDQQSQVNALWNDAGPNQSMGFWLYPVNGGCPDLRKTPQLPFVFGTKVTQAELAGAVNAADLGYCFVLAQRDLRHMTKCSSGQVQLTYEAAAKRYSGSYAFVMADGSKREGKFTAAYCPQEPTP